MTVKADPMAIPARDGYELAAVAYRSTDQPPERVVVIACATGVRQSFYEPYARYLASSGCIALTFDYRGIGKSLRGPIAESSATIRQWGEQDYAGVIDYAAQAFPGMPLQIVGHSVGGQLVGILDNVERASAVCTVTAQHGYWRLYPLAQALPYALLWYLWIPILTWWFSYFPAQRMKLGENLPAGAAREWSRFARSPQYMVTETGKPLRAGFDAYRGPVLAYSFADDPRAPERCVRALHVYFSRAQVEHKHVDPTAVGIKPVGHIGFFRATHKALWKESLDWLRAHSAQAPAPQHGAQGTTATP